MNRFVLVLVILYGIESISPLFYSLNIPLPLLAYYYRGAGVVGTLYVLQGLLSRKFKINLLLVFFTALIVIMTIIGPSGANFVEEAFQGEFFAYLRFWIFLVLGYNFFGEKEVRKGIIYVMYAGIFANLYSFTTITTLMRGSLDSKPLTYQLQYLLVPSFLYLFHYKKLDNLEKRVIMISFVLFAFEQIFFQKRLPLIRIGAELLALGYFSLGGKTKINSSRLVNQAIIGVVLILVLNFGFSLMGFHISDYIDATLDRFNEKSNVSETLEEDDRWIIGQKIYDDLLLQQDVTLGRGFGGAVFDPTFHMIDKFDRRYRAGSEMGIPTIVLKGGITLLIVLGLIALIVFFSYRKIKDYPDLKREWVFLVMWFIFIPSEGFIGSNLQTVEILYAFYIGKFLKLNELRFIPDSLKVFK